MKIRSDLEKPRTPNEMKAILDQLSEDLVTYSDPDVHMRKGIIKPLLEEYRPLHVLANGLEDVCQAWLGPSSNPGPDAFILLKSGKKITIQITVAHQSCNTAWGRERLSQGKHVFPNSKKDRIKQTKEIIETGRILETPEGRLRRLVQDVITAIGKKITNYHSGTDILLVWSSIRFGDSWRNDLANEFQKLGDLRYSGVYVANIDELIELKNSGLI